jgi:tetratricopeptide (TPR) repeat protein
MGLAGLVFMASHAHAQDAREAMAAGAEAYRKGEFGRAEERFRAAADAAAKAKLDPAVPTFNRGNALLNQSRPDDALKAYEDALRTPDLVLQQRAYFNQGNAVMALVDSEGQQGKADAAEKRLEQALQFYVAAMLLDPADPDAKVNYELALAMKQGFLDAVAEAEQLLSRAEALVDAYRYTDVRDILNREWPRQQLAMALRPHLKTKFTTMVENVNKVLKILDEAPINEAPATEPPRPDPSTT